MDRNELAEIMEDQYVIEQEVTENVNEQENEASEEEVQEEVSEEEESEDDEVFVPNETEPVREGEETAGVRRSTRAGNVPTRLGTFIQHMHTVENEENTEEYNENTAQVIAHIMCQYSSTNWRRMSKKKLYQLVQTYTLKKGIQK